MFVKISNEKGLPAAIGESFSAAFIHAYDKEGGDWDAFWDTTGRQLLESVNPYGSPLYAGVVEIMMNQTWWGGPIESEQQRQQNLSPVNRVKDSTSAVAVWLANKLEDGMQLFGGNSPLSPSQIGYFIDQSFGIVGDLTLSEIGEKILGVMQGSANMGDVVNATGSEFYRMISTRVLMDPTSSTDVNDQMYEMRNLVTGIMADVDLNGTSPRLFGIPPEQHKQIAKQLEQQNKKGGVLYQAVKNTSKYWDEIAAVKASKLGKEDQDKQIQAIKTRMAMENIAATRYVEEVLKRAKAN